MALTYSTNLENAEATVDEGCKNSTKEECTKAEIEKKPSDEKKILNDCDQNGKKDDKTSVVESKSEDCDKQCDKNCEDEKENVEEAAEPAQAPQETSKEPEQKPEPEKKEAPENPPAQPVKECVTPQERLQEAKRLVEEAQAQIEFEKLIDETAAEMCLDEGYVKNQLKAHSIKHGSAMKQAKAHAKAAKNAIRKGDSATAVKEQEAYVAGLKQLVEECNSIEDDTKMIAIANSVMTGMFASLAALIVGSSTFTVAAATKSGVTSDPTNPDNRKAQISAINKHFKTAQGKIHAAATAVTSLVAGIVAGKMKYKKNILKYTGGVTKENSWEIPKSRVDAQQKLRRMVRLAEQVLKEYKDIAKIDAEHK